jgi:hypothetical protein
MNAVFFKGVAIDEHVIDIGCAEDIQKRVKNFVNSGLESGRGIRQTEGHNQRLKKAISRIKRSKPFVAVSYPYLIKSRDNV